jgi:hypothetical protein
MKKPDISGAKQLEASDFERYLKLFKDGLSEEHTMTYGAVLQVLE